MSNWAIDYKRENFPLNVQDRLRIRYGIHQKGEERKKDRINGMIAFAKMTTGKNISIYKMVDFRQMDTDRTFKFFLIVCF